MTDEKYVSGEEHHATSHSAARRGHKVTISTHTIAMLLVAIALCGLGFIGGIQYQKHHGGTVVTTAGGTTLGGNTGGFRGGPGGTRRGGDIGQVTAASATSITVQNQRTNASVTYTINSDTVVDNGGQTVDANTIKSGDTVLVVPSSSSSTTASRILVNPSFGGGFGGSSSSSDTTDPTTSN